MIAPSAFSFKFLSTRQLKEIGQIKDTSPVSPISEPKVYQAEEIDDKKRSFLKAAGTIGVVAAVSTLIPKKAEALVFGSHPSSGGGTGTISGPIGLQNASSAQINPATEDTLAGVKGKTDQLTFNSGNLNVNVAAGNVGLKNAGGTTINPATEDTLAAIKTQTDKLTFASGSLQTTVGGTGNIVGVKDTTNTQINPATDESLVYLRRMVKLMESQATVDPQNRQRVVVDGFGAVVTAVGGSQAGVPRVTVANDSNFNTTISTIAAWGDQMFTDPARTAYAVGIRNNLVWS